jgi:hypothetical protein
LPPGYTFDFPNLSQSHDSAIALVFGASAPHFRLYISGVPSILPTDSFMHRFLKFRGDHPVPSGIPAAAGFDSPS